MLRKHLIKFSDSSCICFVLHLATPIDLLGRPKARNLWKDERAKEVELTRNRGIIRTWKVDYMSQLKEYLVHLY